tara:strand:+ start:4364 stop:6256 length:1893 start_codon:yes stop_codon:yes gene_type:complete
MPRKIVKRKPKKVKKRKPKKVKKRKPKKVKKRRRRKFGMTFSSSEDEAGDEEYYDNNNNQDVGKKKSLRTGYVDKRTYPRTGALGPKGGFWGTGTGFTENQISTNKFVDVTLKRLGISLKVNRKEQYSVRIDTLGTFKIDGGEYTGFEINKFYKNMLKSNIPLTRLAKYQPVHNIIQLVFLTQIFVIDKLRTAGRWRKNSKLLQAFRNLQESADPFRNINLLLEDIATQSKDDRIVQAVGDYFPKSGGLRSVRFEDQDGNIVFDDLSLKKKLNPKLLKHKNLPEYIAESEAEFSHFYEDAKTNISENAKTVEWNMVKDFIDDVKEYLIGKDGMPSLFSEELEVYHLKTVAKLPSEEIKVDTLASKGKGGVLLKRKVKTKKRGKQSSQEELVLVGEKGTVQNLTKSMSKMSVKGFKSSSKRDLDLGLKRILKETAGVDLTIPPRAKTLKDLVRERQLDRSQRRRKTVSTGVKVEQEVPSLSDLFSNLKLPDIKPSSTGGNPPPPPPSPLSFGRKKKKGPSSALKKLCKRLKVKLTVKRGKKRVYKSDKVLKAQCKKASKKSSFGKPKKKKVSKKKKSPSAALKKLCKRLKVKLTVKRGKKRVYKSEKVLKGQCKKAAKAKSKKRRKSKFGG